MNKITLLDLSRNQLETLPENLLEVLPALESLNLSRNLFREIPLCLRSNKEHSRLEQLDMTMNALEGALPEELPMTAPNLRILKLAGNQLTSIPSSVRLFGATLKVFMLGSECYGGNLITQLPAEIGYFSHVEEFDVSNNLLTSLPSQIGHLTNVVTLSLYNNKLTVLPPTIARLGNMKTLNLARNELTTLPFELALISTSLVVLDVSHNQLSYIPHQLTESLGNLRVLMSGNPFSYNAKLLNESRTLRAEDKHLISMASCPLLSDTYRDRTKTVQIPSLVELSARVIITQSIQISPGTLPTRLEKYLCLSGFSCSICEGPVLGEYSEKLVKTPANGQPDLMSQMCICSASCASLSKQMGCPVHFYGKKKLKKKNYFNSLDSLLTARALLKKASKELTDW